MNNSEMKTMPKSNIGYEIVKSKLSSKGGYQGRKYLHVVLAHDKERGKWVTWIFNATCGGFFYGNYHESDAQAAKDDFAERCEEYKCEEKSTYRSFNDVL